MRKLIRVAVCAAGLMLVVTAAAAGSAAEAAPSGSGSAAASSAAPTLWLVSTSRMSMADSLDLAAAHYGQGAVTQMLKAMQMRAGSNGTVTLADHGQAVAVSSAKIASAAGAVSAARGAQLAISDAAVETLSAQATSSRITRAVIQPLGAEDWPERGDAGWSGRTYWTGLPLLVIGQRCSSSCTTTDKLSITSVTTNPGAVTTKYSYTLVYTPNGGNFTNNFVRGWAICYGTTECGHTDTVGTGGKIGYVSSSPRMNGNHLAHGYQLFGHFVPYGGTAITDQAKTGSALCAISTSNNTCTY